MLRGIAMIMVAAMLVGCGGQAATDAQRSDTIAKDLTPVSAATSKPTRTPAPTATPMPTRTPAPTATMRPTLTPVPTFAPQVLAGKGQQATTKFNLPDGLVVFDMQHDGKRNFIVKVLDDQGKTVELLVNDIGPFEGSKAVGIKGGTFVMDVSADGNWSITARHPDQVGDGVDQNGVGQEATGLVRLPQGLLTVQMQHDGKRNFIVRMLDAQGKTVELLVNEIGPFDGSKALRVPSAGWYLFDVAADGNWSIKGK